MFFRLNNERIGFEVLIQTFIRKQLRLKAHTVTKQSRKNKYYAAVVCLS